MPLRKRSSPTSRTIVSKLGRPQALSFLYPIDFARNIRSRSQRRPFQINPRQMVSSPATLEAWFFNSLVTVGHCSKHSANPQESYSFSTSQRPNALKIRRQPPCTAYRRQKHTVASSEGEEKEEHILRESAIEPNRTKEELMALVDQYGGESFTDQLPLLELPRLYQPSDGPHLTVSDKAQDEWPPPHHAWPADVETEAKINALDEALKDFSRDSEEIYVLYRDLPAPCVPYLESKTRHKLLRHLAVVERKDEHSMLRYLSVVDDMKVTAIPLNTSEWNSALSFVSRYVARSTAVEVESALHMWREMEHAAGVKGSDVTFNILFDVATKAGKFTLAEMIYKEMHARGFRFDRFRHVSQIHYYGLRGDGDGARAAYKALVEAGEMVDTVVLNCMMSALIYAHEPSAAENIYERMKKIHMETSGTVLPPREFKARRVITKVLKDLAKIAKKDPSKREELQRRSIIAPDLQTYRILVNYSAIHAGELDKAAKFLDEMKWFELPVHGAMFLALLKGFAIHGGMRYTYWTEDRLESVWKAFMEALDNRAIDLYMGKWIVTWGLRAFAKCSGKSRTIDIWEQIKKQWDPEEKELDFVMKTLRQLLEGEDMAENRKDWILGLL